MYLYPTYITLTIGETIINHKHFVFPNIYVFGSSRETDTQKSNYYISVKNNNY